MHVTQKEKNRPIGKLIKVGSNLFLQLILLAYTSQLVAVSFEHAIN